MEGHGLGNLQRAMHEIAMEFGNIRKELNNKDDGIRRMEYQITVLNSKIHLLKLKNGTMQAELEDVKGTVKHLVEELDQANLDRRKMGEELILLKDVVMRGQVKSTMSNSGGSIKSAKGIVPDIQAISATSGYRNGKMEAKVEGDSSQAKQGMDGEGDLLPAKNQKVIIRDARSVTAVAPQRAPKPKAETAPKSVRHDKIHQNKTVTSGRYAQALGRSPSPNLHGGIISALPRCRCGRLFKSLQRLKEHIDYHTAGVRGKKCDNLTSDKKQLQNSNSKVASQSKIKMARSTSYAPIVSNMEGAHHLERSGSGAPNGLPGKVSLGGEPNVADKPLANGMVGMSTNQFAPAYVTAAKTMPNYVTGGM